MLKRIDTSSKSFCFFFFFFFLVVAVRGLEDYLDVNQTNTQFTPVLKHVEVFFWGEIFTERNFNDFYYLSS